MGKGSGRRSVKRTVRRHPVGLSVCLVAWAGLLLGQPLGEAATSLTRPACDQCEEADRFVRLQQVSEEVRGASSRQFMHPFFLTPAEWTTLLTTLQVQRQAEGLLFRDSPGSVIPVFTVEEIGYLSTTLSKAFARAQPNEWVVFGISRLNSYNMTEITTGGWFLDGPSLHVVLANYRKVVTMPSTRQLLWERPMRPDAGPHYDLVAGRHQTIVRDAGAWSGLFSSAPSELRISYQGALLGESVETVPPQQNRPSSSEKDPLALLLEDRLRTLKQLHDQGLISDDDYRVKKQQLLDRF